MSPADESPKAAAPESGQTFSQWLHQLRNEVNTATMAVAAAEALLQMGDAAQAQANLRRAQQAGRRCAMMLGKPPER